MLVALGDDLITHFLLTINACMCILYCIVDLTVHFLYGFASAKIVNFSKCICIVHNQFGIILANN